MEVYADDRVRLVSRGDLLAECLIIDAFCRRCGVVIDARGFGRAEAMQTAWEPVLQALRASPHACPCVDQD
ncbi:MAG: hypothetical protein ACREM3_26175 [Candidatus Rokuibacteriota bacterium]